MSTLEGESERALRKVIRTSERTLERLASLDVRKVVRERKADALIAEGEQAVAASRAASEELRRRGRTRRPSRRLPESLMGIIPTWKTVPSGSHPAAAALRAVAKLGHPELTGATLTATTLTEEEGAELAALVKRRVQTGDAGLSDSERSRYEFLVGRAAGSENLFAESRRDRAAREKLDELTKEARMATLPKRVKYEESGSVVVPAFVFEWLKTSREASWTIADLGMLVAVLGIFANRDPALINGARFEKDSDGEDVLVVPEDVVFLPDANPHPLYGGPGQVNPAVALATLARNKWIDVQRADGGFRIRLGFRAKVDR